MARMIIRLSFFVLLFSFTEIYSQIPQRCLTTEHHQDLIKKHPYIAKQHQALEAQVSQTIKTRSLLKTASVDTTIYTIPVVVHIIHTNSNGAIGGTNISDAQILSQIDVLNEDYRKKPGTPGFNTNPIGADVNFEFCLATRDPAGNITSGITRTYNSKTSYDYNSDDSYVKSLSYWPSDQYLNIWVVPKITDPQGDIILGYAQLPYGTSLQGLDGTDPGALTDGILISYQAFGRTGHLFNLYNKGKTTSHEVGHWLGGLRHIWGDDYCGDDFVADTPPDAAANQDNDCIDSSNCAGVWIQDLTSDYLDYSPDMCLNVFTQGQKERMRTAFLECPRRNALISSKGCCGILSSVYNIPYKEDFETGSSSLSKWVINPAVNGWQISNPGSYSKSSQSLFVHNSSANSNTSDYFESPFLNLESNFIPFLKFDLAYSQNNSLISDTLIISYNYSCNNNWLPLTVLSGDKLSTTFDIRNNFIPYSKEWKTIYLDISQFSKIDGIKFRFENHSAGANNMYVDNINIDLTSGNLEINVYPNPTFDFLKYDVLLKDEKDLNVQIFTCLGEKILDKLIHVNDSLHDEIDVQSLSSGLYIMKVSGNGKSKIIKVLINL